nr:tetratricopeptide repeat protein [Campylobacterota bacterium]
DELKKAEASYRESLEITKALEQKSKKKYANSVAWNLTKLAHTHKDLNQTGLFKQELEEAEKIYLKSVKLFRGLARKNPKLHQQNLAWSLNMLANFYLNEKREPKKSIKPRKEALDIYRKLVKKNPKVFDLRLYKTINSLAKGYMQLHRLEMAKSAYTEGLSLIKKMFEEDTSYSNYLALSFKSLGTLHTKEESYEKATSYYQQALTVYRKLAIQEPKIYRANITLIHHDIATLYSHKQEFSTAKQEYQKVIEEYKVLNRFAPLKYHANIAKALNSLAQIEIMQENLSKSKEQLNRAIVFGKAISKENSRSSREVLSVSYARLAFISWLKKDITSALSYYQKSLNLVSNFVVAKSYVEILVEKNRYKDAQAFFELMLKTYTQKEQKAEIWMMYGKFYLDISSDGGEEKLKKSLKLYSEIYKEDATALPEVQEIRSLIENNTTHPL